MAVEADVYVRVACMRLSDRVCRPLGLFELLRECDWLIHEPMHLSLTIGSMVIGMEMFEDVKNELPQFIGKMIHWRVSTHVDGEPVVLPWNEHKQFMAEFYIIHMQTWSLSSVRAMFDIFAWKFKFQITLQLCKERMTTILHRSMQVQGGKKNRGRTAELAKGAILAIVESEVQPNWSLEFKGSVQGAALTLVSRCLQFTEFR